MADVTYTRRDFFCHSASCAAHVGLMSAFAPAWSRQLWATQERFPVVASKPWGRIEKIAEGVWALVSRPLEDRATLCNGGIIAGRSGVVLIEAFASDEGARWMAEQATRLAGRAPTHVVLTHYHPDHTGGLAGAKSVGDPAVLATPGTREGIRGIPNAPRNELLNRSIPLDAIRPTEIDLGDRSVLIVPRRGHTNSDITVEITEPAVTFCGDLVWNDMFPNYIDATPSRLTQAVRLLRATGSSTYVPGHGPLADEAALDRYIELLDHVEAAARDAMVEGISAHEAGARYRLPPSVTGWHLFNDGYFERAIGSWMTELGNF